MFTLLRLSQLGHSCRAFFKRGQTKQKVSTKTKNEKEKVRRFFVETTYSFV